MTHTSRVPLRWSDLDAFGHVNNAVYLTLCEQARTEALDTLMPGGWDGTSAPVVASVALTYRRPIRRVGTAVVTVAFETPGRTSMRTRYSVALDGDDGGVCADGEATLVWVSAATGRPVPVPDVLRAAIEARRADGTA